ncbi:MAG: FtsL-like putative cell division protein [Prevotellaceae bacterium]|nr:FtsL-like putative cell division protein [Prevotellaceae bacterium]
MAEDKNDIVRQEDIALEQDRKRALEKLKNLGSDDDSIKGSLSLMRVLGGDILTARMIRSQIGLIMLIVALLIVYISNRYSSDQEIQEIDRLQSELVDAKYKALSSASLLTEKCRQSRVLELLKENNDTLLSIPDRPPYIIETEE